MKLGPVTELDKRNKTSSKKLDDGIMSENYDAIVIIPIVGQFGPIQNLGSGHIACKTYIFINSNLKNLTKNCKQN